MKTEKPVLSDKEVFYWRLQEKVAQQYKEVNLETVRAVFGIAFTFNAIDAQINRRLHAADMTLPGLNCLMLVVHGNPDGFTLTEISQLLMTSRANLTGVIDSLVHRGYVTREDHATDRRAFVVRATPAGKKWLHGYFPAHATMMSSFAAVLNAGERKELLRLLAKVRENVMKRVPS